MSHQELMERDGADSVEIIMWLVMRGALSPAARCVHCNYYLPMVAGFAGDLRWPGRRRPPDPAAFVERGGAC